MVSVSEKAKELIETAKKEEFENQVNRGLNYWIKQRFNIINNGSKFPNHKKMAEEIKAIEDLLKEFDIAEYKATQEKKKIETFQIIEEVKKQEPKPSKELSNIMDFVLEDFNHVESDEVIIERMRRVNEETNSHLSQRLDYLKGRQLVLNEAYVSRSVGGAV